MLYLVPLEHCCIIYLLKGHLRSFYDVIRSLYIFANNCFNREEIEAWERCQSVRLTKTHQLICNMTYLSHFVTLTLGDPRSNLQIETLRSKSISIDRT